MKSKADSNDPIRKIAVLVSTLDQQAADELLQRLPQEQAAAVRNLLVNLDEVSQAEQERIAREFLHGGGVTAPAESSGVELDESLAEKLASPGGYSDHLARDSEPVRPPFQFLRDAATDAIAKHLAHEGPQIAALVVAHLPPEQAADLIAHFEPTRQTEVLRRVAELDLAESEAIRDVEQHLESLLSEEIRLAKNRETGLSVVASILAAAGGRQGKLVHNLTRHQSALAARLPTPSLAAKPCSLPSPKPVATSVKKRPIKQTPTKRERQTSTAEGELKPTEPSVTLQFDELAHFSDAALARVFRRSDPQLGLLALAGADPDFVDRLLAQLPRREATSLQRRMEAIGPLRLKDVEHAQDQIAAVASRLAADKQIDLPTPKRFAVAA